jgi:hypothetical protein
MIKAEIKRRVTEELLRELSSFGVQKKGDVFRLPFGDGFSGLVALNFIMYEAGRSIGLNPIVGLISEPVEKLLIELAQEEFKAPCPSLTSSIGYLTPEHRYVEWKFGIDASPELHLTQIRDLTAKIQLYGFPMMEENRSLGAIISALEQHKHSSIQRAVYHLPIAYMLSKRLETAESYLSRQLEEMRERTDTAAHSYRLFAARCLESPGFAR